MKCICAVFAAAAISSVGVLAQTQAAVETSTRTIDVKDGRKTTVSGCLEKNPGGGYMLTDGEGDLIYTLVTDKDLTPQLSRRVSIRGKATDLGDAKLMIESTLHTRGSSGAITEKVTTELSGALGLRYLGVESVETVSGNRAADLSWCREGFR